MKTLGLIGGTSWHSTIEYYKLINELAGKKIGTQGNPPLIIHSINIELMREQNKEKINAKYLDVAQKLARIESSTNNKRKFALYSFEPDEQSVLDAAVPAVLMTVIYQLLLESLASEHSARVVAMRNASDNAGEMYDELKLNFNRARQAAITQEISEIVGGSAAVS
jgi:aspartate racemase